MMNFEFESRPTTTPGTPNHHHHHHHHQHVRHPNGGTPPMEKSPATGSWRSSSSPAKMKPKRGISLDGETLARRSSAVAAIEYDDDDDQQQQQQYYFDDDDDDDLENQSDVRLDMTDTGSNKAIVKRNQLIDGLTAQYYRASSAISENEQPTTAATATSASFQNKSSNGGGNRELVKCNHHQDAGSGGNFRFTSEALTQFKVGQQSQQQQQQQDGMAMDGRSTTTRATTPGDEQIFQEPVESLQVRIGRLLSCEEMADMHFLVGSGTPGPFVQSPAPTGTNNNQPPPLVCRTTPSPTSPFRKLRIPAHRLVMATASPVFKQILVDPGSGQLIECRGDLEITDIEPVSFLEFLRYSYTDGAKLNKDNVVGVWVAARRYQIQNLERQCTDYIEKCLGKKSCLAIWMSARNYGENELERVARKSMQHYAESMLLSNDFLRLEQSALFELMSDDLLRADEIVIFRALCRWAKQNCLRNGLCPNRANVRMMIGPAINLVRFPLMTEEQLQKIVAAEGILEDELLRALVHCSRNWPRATAAAVAANPHHHPGPAETTFSNEPRAYQRLNGRLHNVYRFGSFENSLPNRYLNRSLNFLANKRVWLAGVGLYAPRKACTFYLNVWVRVRRADQHPAQQQPCWTSPLDRVEQNILLKYDGSGHIINVNFEEPLQVEANVQYEVSATITPSPRSTSLVRARLHPHLYYTRPNEVNFYYGTEGQYATKIRINQRGENVIFNFNWERETLPEDLSDNVSNFGPHPVPPVVGPSSSEPSTPNPPPRPPPPQEYRRPSRMQRLRRALSFVDRREQDGIAGAAGREQHARESGLLEGQIPLLMFYA